MVYHLRFYFFPSFSSSAVSLREWIHWGKVLDTLEPRLIVSAPVSLQLLDNIFEVAKQNLGQKALFDVCMYSLVPRSSPAPVFDCFSILQVIKTWSRGRPGNEARLCVGGRVDFAMFISLTCWAAYYSKSECQQPHLHLPGFSQNRIWCLIDARYVSVSVHLECP